MKMPVNTRKETSRARALSFTDQAKIQKQYATIFLTIFATPQSSLVKQKDAVIIAIYLLGKPLGFSSERTWHCFVEGNLFTNRQFIERFRYNRRCRALFFVIKWIR